MIPASLCSNNRIARIDATVVENLTALKSLVLTNNHLKHLSDVDVLAAVRHPDMPQPNPMYDFSSERESEM